VVEFLVVVYLGKRGGLRAGQWVDHHAVMRAGLATSSVLASVVLVRRAIEPSER
jgi:hypothetical protein